MKYIRKLFKICIACTMCFAIYPIQKQLLDVDAKSSGNIYYVDSNSAVEHGDGKTPQTAFKYLVQVNEKLFQPGDKILLKAGSEFTGTLYPKGSGSEGMPIIIDQYGEGTKPKINANGATFMPQKKDWQGPFVGEDGKQIGAAVYLYNQQYVEIHNLDVQNPGGNQNSDRSGIRVEGYDAGILHHIYIQDCYVHDVRGYNGQDDIYPVIPTNEDGSPLDGYIGGDQQNPNTSNTFWGARTTHRTGGINFVTYTARKKEAKNKFNVLVQDLDESKKITTFDDIRIEHNTIENCQANGITTTNVKGTLDDVNFRHTNVIISDNNIHGVTRAGIIPLYTSGVRVEFNKVDTFQSTTEGYGCGIWCDRADHMIFQYNEVCNGQNGNDGMAFNLDDMTRDGVIQYNYTHDNYGGGYMLHVRQKSYNTNNTIRYNLSVNDSGAFVDHNAQIVVVGETDITKLEQAKVYNNTFISNKECHAVFKGDDVTYTNNIWYFTNPGMLSRNNSFAPGANSTFSNNAYIGVPVPTDSGAHQDNPLFTGGTSLFHLDKEHAYVAASLQSNSPYINKGIAITNDGGKDIVGRDIKEHRNLGAFGGNGHNSTPQSPVTIKANDSNLKRYTADGEQTTVIQETASEAHTKWVNTTFQSEPVIYTQKKANYISLSFHGTGGVLKLKRGGGAGLAKITVSLANDAEHILKTVQVNTHHDAADTIIVNDFKDLGSDNKDYELRVYNDEEGKATNFMSFTSQVAEASSSCPNDEVTAVILEEAHPAQIPYGEQQTSISLYAHVFEDTCHPDGQQIPVTYQVSPTATLENNTVTFPKAGDYQITATASKNGKQVSTVKNIHVTMGSKPQVNVMPVFTIGLQNLIMNSETVNLHEYMNKGQAQFIAKLSDAKAILIDKDATQDMINTAESELKAAKNALLPCKVNAEDSSVTKDGNWIKINDTTLDNGTALKSGVRNESMHYTFYGNEIKVYGRKAVGTGITSFKVVKVENNEEIVLDTKDVDCFSPEKKDQSILYTWHGDKNGKYRLDIVNTGNKNTSASDCNTIIDYFKLSQITSSNANLSSIQGVDLHEPFDKNTLLYTADVASDIDHINLQALSEQAAAVVKIDGPDALAVGKNTFTITVTAEDNITTKIYKVEVNRAAKLSSNNYLQGISGILLQQPFDKDRTEYTAEVPYETMTLNLQAQAEDNKATLDIVGVENLKVGQNIVKILVKAENGTQKQYQIQVTRKPQIATSVETVTSMIQTLPNHIDKQQASELVQIVKQYDKLSEQEKQNIAKSTMDKLNSAKQQLAILNHTANTISIKGLPWNVEVKAAPLTISSLETKYKLKNIVEAYDITLYDIMDNQEYMPKKEVSVNIQLNAKDSKGTWNLYHIDQGIIKEVPITVKDAVLTFKTKQFSPYIVTRQVSPSNQDEHNHNTTVNTADSTHLQMWELVGSAALFVIVVCFVKKNRADHKGVK